MTIQYLNKLQNLSKEQTQALIGGLSWKRGTTLLKPTLEQPGSCRVKGELDPHATHSTGSTPHRSRIYVLA